jgi:hypothetical protein
MTTADDIFDQSFSNIQGLGLREIPFTESPIDLGNETLQRIFTGRQIGKSAVRSAVGIAS